MCAEALYKVTWRDHYSQDGWTDPDNFTVEDYVVTTVGYLIMENDNYICLAGSMSTTGMANSIMCILKADVLNQEEIKYE